MKNMKTIKSLLYLLVAAGALAVVGCTKDETYTKGGDIDGERIYIDNSQDMFYVRTAEEKQEEEAQLAKLSRGLKQNIESSDDDKSVTINVCRLNSKLAAYTTTIELTLPSDSYQLFKLPAGATQSGAGSGTVIYSFEVSFDEGADKAPFEIGFNIDELAENTEYYMNATIADDGNTTNYGASSFDFVILHSTTVELPFTDIGTVTTGEPNWFGSEQYPGIIIQMHNDDYKKITEGKKEELEYIRLLIPRFMYQLAAASIEAGDGWIQSLYTNTPTDDEILADFAQYDNILLTMTPNYEPLAKIAGTYPHPIFPDQYQNKFDLFAMAGVNISGEMTIYTSSGTGEQFSPIDIGAYNSTYGDYVHYIYWQGNGSTVTRSLNVYTYNPLLYMLEYKGSFGLFPITIQWDENDLEPNWDTYFTIDYNNSIDYVKAEGSGTFSSTAFPTDDQGTNKPQTWAQDLYVGFDAATGSQVYYLPNVYQTVTSEENEYGLAVLVNGSSVTVASDQPLGMQWNGNEIYAQQSESIASSIEYAEDGSVKKLTLGVAFVLPNGNVMADYTETYEFNSSAAGVEAFYGTYTQNTYEIYTPFDESEQDPDPSTLVSPISSTLTIEKAVDSDGKEIAGKVFITGLIDASHLSKYNASDGRLVGEYDATSNSIIIPAQYIYKPKWDIGVGVPILPYFQPGVVGYNAYNTDEGPYWLSEIAAASESCALYLGEDKNLTFGFSTTDTSGNKANTYAIQMNYFDPNYQEFDYYKDLYVAYPLSPITFTRSTASGSSVKVINASSIKNFSNIKNLKGSSKKAAAYNFPQLGKSINPEQLGR